MGGLFSSPSPPPLPPAPSSVPDPEEEDRRRRLEALERRRRGRTGMVRTSDRGLLAPTQNEGGKKSLLGG